MDRKDFIEIVEQENYLEAIELFENNELLGLDNQLVEYITYCYISLNKYEEAISFMEETIKEYPFDLNLNLNLATLYDACEKDDLAYQYYSRVQCMLELNENRDETLVEEVNNAMVALASRINRKIKNCNDLEEEKLKQMVININEKAEYGFGIVEYTKWALGAKGVDKSYIDAKGEKHFTAVYQRYRDNKWDSLPRKRFEILKVVDEGKRFEFYFDEDTLLPIYTGYDAPIYIIENNKENKITHDVKQFYYYRVKGEVIVSSTVDLVIGTPITLKRDPRKKALILNIFIDGLSQKLLEEYGGMEKLMPKTYEYFENGIYFENAYSTSEWTYPSMASYFQGLYATESKLFSPDLGHALRNEYKTIMEIFHDAGYYTAKIDGDWRSTPAYGYDKGTERILFKRGSVASEIICQAMEHIATFKETNQFLWIVLANLHDVADGLELSPCVQKDLSLTIRSCDNTKDDSTSVKKSYNETLRERYIKQISYVDTYLGMLFSFLKDNFGDNEVLVSVVSDHGQGYLVEPNKHFLSDYRTKVPVLLRGVSEKRLYAPELVSILDYPAMICKAADIEYKEKTTSHVPMILGGESERQYVYAESLHPGDPYQVMIKDESCQCFFSSHMPVSFDGFINLSEEDIFYIHDLEGNLVSDEEKENYYLNIIQKHIAPYINYKV